MNKLLAISAEGLCLTRRPRYPACPAACVPVGDFSFLPQQCGNRRQEAHMSTGQPGIADVVTETMVAVETVARALHVKDARLEPTLDAIVANAAATHPAADDAGLILLVRGQLGPPAVTGRPP